MADFGSTNTTRRSLLGGAVVAAGLLALPLPALAAGTKDPALAAVRSLLAHASKGAFAALSANEGFWNSSVARISLSVLYGQPGALPPGVLSSSAFREDLQHRLNGFAQAGLARAARAVSRKIAGLKVADPAAVLSGGPTAATSQLRQDAGPAVVNAMTPSLLRALVKAKDPVVEQAVHALKGVTYRDVAQSLSNAAESAIWYQLGAEEAAIRRDPQATGDAALIAGLKRG